MNDRPRPDDDPDATVRRPGEDPDATVLRPSDETVKPFLRTVPTQVRPDHDATVIRTREKGSGLPFLLSL